MGIIISWNQTKHLISLSIEEDCSTITRHSLTKTDFFVIIGSLPVKNKIAGSGDCSHALIVYYNEIVILKLRTSINNKQTFTIKKGTVIWDAFEVKRFLYFSTSPQRPFVDVEHGWFVEQGVNGQIDLWNTVVDVERMQTNRANVRKNSTPHRIDGRWV